LGSREVLDRTAPSEVILNSELPQVSGRRQTPGMTPVRLAVMLTKKASGRVVAPRRQPAPPAMTRSARIKRTERQPRTGQSPTSGH